MTACRSYVAVDIGCPCAAADTAAEAAQAAEAVAWEADGVEADPVAIDGEPGAL